VYTKKVALSISIVFMFLLSILFSNFVVASSNHHDFELCSSNIANWTVMYYVCGDSNMDVYVDPLLENLSKIGSDDELNIVCLVDKIGYGNSKLIYINETGEQTKLNDFYGWPDEVDTGNLNTLELFCTQMMINFPAKYYALIVFASGGLGWQGYYIGDKDSKNVVTVPDFANSLKNIVNKTGHKIDVLVGSCAVNMIENAYEFNPFVNYFVGTQDCLPDRNVIPMFSLAVSELKNNESLDAEEFSIQAPIKYETVSFIYVEGYGGRISFISKLFDKLPFSRLHSVVHHSNLASINLSQISDLTTSFDDLVSYLILHLNDKDIFNDIKNTRKQVCELGKCGTKFWFLSKFYRTHPFEFLAFDCYVDLYDLIRLLKENIQNSYIKSKCNNVLEKINQTIAFVKKNNDAPNCGLSIYFPGSKFMYNRYRSKGKIPSPYEDLSFSKDTLWDEFLRAYLKIQTPKNSE
jgi:hypothetical protein